MSLSPMKSDKSPAMADICLNLDSQFESMQDSTVECMRVYARVRPLLKKEKVAGFEECIAAIDEETVRALTPVRSVKYKNSRGSQVMEDFTFTGAFGPETGQFVFFEKTMFDVLQNFIEGRNSLVFTYGVTGSGKTYTLQGNSENPGIVPLSLKIYFSALKNQILSEPIVKPEMFSNVTLLSDSQKKEELQLKSQLLSMFGIEDGSVMSKSSAKKSFNSILCDFLTENVEFEERETTLPPEDMAAAQAVCQMKELSKKSADLQSGYCCIWVSFVEIYNEAIYDLLKLPTLERTRLNYAEDKNGDVYIKGVREVCVKNYEEALQLLNIGRRNLRIASTKLNYQSSRSHCIYSLKVLRIPDIKNITHATVNRSVARKACASM